MTLIGVVQLGPAGCAAARAEALKLEQHAYQVSKNIYGKTPPAADRRLPRRADAHRYANGLADAAGIADAVSHTNHHAGQRAKPTPVPANNRETPATGGAFQWLQRRPDPASAPNYPVRIVKVNKTSEVVTLQNLSGAFVSVEDWNMRSLNGNQEHDQIGGVLAPGQTRDFPNTGGGPIWADSQRDDGALYDATGALVSYWIDQ